MALGAAAEDVPAQAGGNGKVACGVPGVLHKGRVVGARFGGEQILGEVRIVCWIPCRAVAHARQERSEVAAAAALEATDWSVAEMSKAYEPDGRDRLADVEEALHVFEAGGDAQCLPRTLVSRNVGVVVFAGILEGVVVGRAANAAAVVVEDHEGKQLVVLPARPATTGSRVGDVVSHLARIAALVLVVARTKE